MADQKPNRIEDVLNGFVEVMARLMIDQYQRQIAELDLTLPQAQVLRVLRGREMTTGRLAAEMKISAPAITQLTDRLLRKELIERQVAADDRRCVLVALSEKGSRLLEEFRKRRSDIFTRALAHLSAADQGQVIEVLSKVVQALEDYESETLPADSNGQGHSTVKKAVELSFKGK